MSFARLRVTTALLSSALLSTALCCQARPAGPATVALHSGSNAIDFGQGANKGMAMLAHRENFNAHGFDVLTLYIKPRAADQEIADWQLVSIFDGDKESLLQTSGGGADCTLHDFRLVRDQPGGVPRLIVARRDAGNSYADAAAVHFTYYTLRHNGAGDVGRPLYYFNRDHETMAAKAYCDVGDAFDQELGIKPYRR